MRILLTIFTLSLASSSLAASAKVPASQDSTGLKIPASSQHEHKELREALQRAVSSGGKTADIAKDLSAVMDSHFVNEEQFVMPHLSLLAPLAKNAVPAQSAEAIKLADTLRKELPTLLNEHKKVAPLLIDLKAAALKEDKREFVIFADNLSQHAGQEEEILYPAAIIVGEYLKKEPRLFEVDFMRSYKIRAPPPPCNFLKASLFEEERESKRIDHDPRKCLDLGGP